LEGKKYKLKDKEPPSRPFT